MPRLLGLRNVILIVGAYYLAAWVMVPLWIPISRLAEGRVYHPGWESFWMDVFNMVPIALGSMLAGVTVGYFMETARPLVWAFAAGVFVGLCTWSSTHWHINPEASDLFAQGVRALVAAAIAFAACWFIERRRQSLARSNAPA
jgi:hypothetical protein